VPGTPKEYVQDRIRVRKDAVARLLADEDCFVYVCGLRKMEEGVLAALAEVATAAGLPWEPLLERLRTEGRFHLESY
jgi:sulfite reductase alpha subunit-like flavoprotein